MIRIFRQFIFQLPLQQLLCFLLLSLSTLVHAVETECNTNGGLGWEINDGGITNLSVPFNFGDDSVIFDLDVSANIAHTYMGDLTLSVTNPTSGTEVLLFERPGTTAGDTAPVNSFPYGCNQNNLNATFDDETGTTNIENVCTTPIAGNFLPHNPAPNNLAAFDGDNLNGNWNVYLSDSANGDVGTLNEVCLTASFAGVTFDKWVSSNASCSDSIDSIAVAPGTDLYFCYSVFNPSSETFSINPGGTSDSQGHDLSPLERTYLPAETFTMVDGPFIAGTDLPVGTTVNNAQVIATFSTPNFTGTIPTPEVATAVVGNPIFNTSIKTVVDLNAGSAEQGDVLQYTVTINETAGIYTPNVQLTDIVDANLETITFTTLPTGAINNTVGNNIDITGITLPANGSVSIVFEATIAASTPSGTNLNNTATITHAPSTVTFDAIAPTVIVAAPDLSTSTKTAFDVDGSPSLAGDLIRYTIIINETGGNAATDITVTDTVDSNLTNVTIISLPVGAIDNTIANNINISNINVAANGSQTITFEANIVASASVGTQIKNTATVTDIPSSATVSPVAGTIIVGATPTSGAKQLYLNNLNTSLDLTRVPIPTANTNTANFSGGNFVDIDQTPVFQSPFTISSGSTVTVFLNLRRRTAGGARTVQVELLKGLTDTPIGTGIDTGDGAGPGSTSKSWNAGANQYLSFQYTIASDVTFNANDFIRVRTTNTSPNNRNIQVRSLIAGNISQVQMVSNTVINIDSIGVYAEAFSTGNTQYPSYVQGSTVFIRATVSDPFGNADITSANLTITDSASTARVSSVAMTAVATPSGELKVFEYQYSIPASPQGIWALDITAIEGTEGVFHNVQSPMIVGTTLIEIGKTSKVISDTVNATNPKAIPNAIVEYTISVNNSGFGYADNNSVIIDDPLPSGVSFFFGSPLNPADLIDGSISSGLSYNFLGLASTADDISFSNNGGISFITPSIDASGFDITAPAINYIRINPKGIFKGSNDGINIPSFELKYRVKVN